MQTADLESPIFTRCQPRGRRGGPHRDEYAKQTPFAPLPAGSRGPAAPNEPNSPASWPENGGRQKNKANSQAPTEPVAGGGGPVAPNKANLPGPGETVADSGGPPAPNEPNFPAFWPENGVALKNKADPARLSPGGGRAERGNPKSQALHPKESRWPGSESKNDKQSQFARRPGRSDFYCDGPPGFVIHKSRERHRLRARRNPAPWLAPPRAAARKELSCTQDRSSGKF